MNTDIYYFSGTGNSLHIAKELQKRLTNTNLIPMISAVESNNMETKADTVGFIFPIHCLGIPIFVKRFLNNIKIKSASYLFAVTSRECSTKVFSEINRIISKQCKKLDSCFSVKMPETYLPIFEVDNKDEISKKEADMLKELDSMNLIITDKKKYQKPDPKKITMYVYYIIRPIIMFIFNRTRYFNLENKIYVDMNCSGCGICSRICLSNRIEMKNNKPIWNKKIKCIFCFACIHYCPNHAIQIKNSKTIVRGRYHHPEISIEEIINQKTQ